MITSSGGDLPKLGLCLGLKEAEISVYENGLQEQWLATQALLMDSSLDCEGAKTRGCYSICNDVNFGYCIGDKSSDMRAAISLKITKIVIRQDSFK
uniref:Phosphoserine phosphatase n=1 Tax=Heterorhabditis bacteriophora TaxID=37862 RepID=A0A1I7WIV6_HETBA